MRVAVTERCACSVWRAETEIDALCQNLLYMLAHGSGWSGKSFTIVHSLSCYRQLFRAHQAAATRAEPAGNVLRHLQVYLHAYRF